MNQVRIEAHPSEDERPVLQEEMTIHPLDMIGRTAPIEIETAHGTVEDAHTPDLALHVDGIILLEIRLVTGEIAIGTEGESVIETGTGTEIETGSGVETRIETVETATGPGKGISDVILETLMMKETLDRGRPMKTKEKREKKRYRQNFR